jgi:environmental stress-induced protein Ves
MHLITRSSYRTSTWKNGLGTTSEIAIHPEGAALAKGDFLWRVSSARINAAAAFSEFPNHDRTLVILEGGGVRLFHQFSPEDEPETVEIPPLEPYEFPGDVPSRCELLEGPVADFSVFIRKGEIEAQTRVARLGAGERLSWELTGRWNFAFAASGAFKTDGLTLPRGDTLLAEASGPADACLECTSGPGALLLVSLAPNQAS